MILLKDKPVEKKRKVDDKIVVKDESVVKKLRKIKAVTIVAENLNKSR
jgi:hypothetical protein